jgi:hypothetical protein
MSDALSDLTDDVQALIELHADAGYRGVRLAMTGRTAPNTVAK